MIFFKLLLISCGLLSVQGWNCFCNYSKDCCPAPDPELATLDPVMMCEDRNFGGNCFAQSIRQKNCTNLKEHSEADKASSVNTFGKCFRLYEHKDCQGKSVVVAPGTKDHYALFKLGFNDMASSVGTCFSADQFCLSSPETTRKRRSQNNQPCFFATDILIVGALSWLLRDQANLGTNSPVQYYQTHATNGRTEVMEAVIHPRHLDTGTDTNAAARQFASSMGEPGDDAGHILARRLGGSGTDTRNIFPQSRNINRGVWAQAMEAMVYEEVHNHGPVSFTVNLYYSTDTDTRPDLIVARLVRLNDGHVVVINDFENPPN